MSATLDPPAISPAVVAASGRFFRIPPTQPLLMTATWAEYLWLDARREELGSKTKLTFHRGQLEMRSHAFWSANLSGRFGMVVRGAAFAGGIRHLGAGGMTVSRPDLEVATEADECYYFDNWQAVVGLRDLDFTVHPPPDLALEVDRSGPAFDKCPVYAALGVLEFWRLTDGVVAFYILTRSGHYEPTSHSICLPSVSADDVTELLNRPIDDDTAFFRLVTEWAETLKITEK